MLDWLDKVYKGFFVCVKCGSVGIVLSLSKFGIRRRVSGLVLVSLWMRGDVLIF